MKVAIVANGDPAFPHVLEDWPSEWRLPVVGERLKIPEIHETTLEVSNVVWHRDRDPSTGGVFWGVEIWVWGPAFRAKPGS